MAERYKVTVEEDNDFSIVSWLIVIGLGILCFVYNFVFCLYRNPIIDIISPI